MKKPDLAAGGINSGPRMMHDNPQAEWLSLLRYMHEEECRELLGERGAAMLSGLLRRGDRFVKRRRVLVADPVQVVVVARVLGELYGHPSDLLA